MPKKLDSRIRRATKVRAAIAKQKAIRLCIHRSSQHIYAQVLDPTGGKVLASASSLEAEIKLASKDAEGKLGVATIVGKKIGERAKALGLSKVAFDRSGFKYHGRVKALADAAREAGLDF